MNENTQAPLRVAAKQVIDTKNTLCEQLISVIKNAFGEDEKVTVGVHIEPMGNGIEFEIKGRWTLPNDLWFKPCQFM